MLTPHRIDWYWAEKEVLSKLDDLDRLRDISVDLGELKGAGVEISGLLPLLSAFNYIGAVRSKRVALNIIDDNHSPEHNKYYKFPLQRLGFGDCLQNKVNINSFLKRELSYDNPTLLDRTKFKISQVEQDDPEKEECKNRDLRIRGYEEFKDFIYYSAKSIIEANVDNDKKAVFYVLAFSLSELLENVAIHAWYRPALKKCNWFQGEPSNLNAYYTWRVMRQSRDVRKNFKRNDPQAKRNSFFSNHNGAFIELCVADVGCGIRASLEANNNLESKIQFDSEAKSLQAAFSKNNDVVYGLHSIRKKVLSVGGYLEVRTGNSCIVYRPCEPSNESSESNIQCHTIENMSLYPGTMVRILAPSNYLNGRYDS